MAARIALYDDPAFWDAFFADLESCTDGGIKVAERNGGKFKAVQARINNSPELRKRYEAALRLQAEQHADKVGEILEKLETDAKFRSDRARELMKGHQWLAGVKDRERFGNDKQPLIQVNFDTAGLNALRQLASMPAPQLIDGEFVEVKQESPPGEGGPARLSLDELLE